MYLDSSTTRGATVSLVLSASKNMNRKYAMTETNAPTSTAARDTPGGAGTSSSLGGASLGEAVPTAMIMTARAKKKKSWKKKWRK